MIVVHRKPALRRWPFLLFAGTLLCVLSGATALAATGGLTQKPGTAGCISEEGSAGACVDGRGLVNPLTVAISPDGKNAYVGGLDSIAIFNRDPVTGALTQKAGAVGCLRTIGNGGGVCGEVRDIDDVESIAISPDGTTLYAANGIAGGVAILDRNPVNGTLSQKAGTAGCAAVVGLDGCAVSRATVGSFSVAVSPDGKSVYLASQQGGLAIFDRDPATGGLTQKPGRFGCYSDDGTDSMGGDCVQGVALKSTAWVAVSPDGKNVYVASGESDSIASFNRGATGGLSQKPGKAGCISANGTGGACAIGRALSGAAFVMVSPSGTSVYVAAPGKDSVAAFSRSTANGKLTQLAGTAGCVSETGSRGACANGRALESANGVAVSPGGASVYVTSPSSQAVAVFNRSGAGALTQQSGKAGCVSETGTGGSCADGTALDEAAAVTVSPDAENVYVASADGQAITIFDRAGGTKPPPGGGGGGGGGTDTTPPDLKIDKKPKKKIETKHEKVKVKVKFSSEDGATFTCRLDKKDFKPCSSPYKAKLKAGRHKAKKHKIKIVATDAAGNASEATTVKVNVKRKRKGH
jgi:DNA-binding beta-propeller fold protein YncE